VRLRSISRFVSGLAILLFSVALAGCGASSTIPTPPVQNNPIPTITSLSPTSALAGAGQQTLTINGSNFLTTSTVSFAGASRSSAFVNSGQLTIQLSVADQTSAGQYPIVVSNPSPGGGASAPVNFTVDNLQPTLNSVSPLTLATGSPDTIITVTGSNFVSTSTVNLNGTALATTFVSLTQLSATIPSTDLTNKSVSQVTVTSPLPGGGTSGSQSLTVTPIGSFVIVATPTNAGQGDGPWLIAIAAVDSAGAGIPGLPVSLGATTGILSQAQGTTDATGTFRSSVSPPASYSGQVIAVSATTGDQTTAINVVFVPSVFKPSNAIVGEEVRLPQDSPNSTPAVLSSPFLMGISSTPGSKNPFVAQPSLCFSNIDLVSTVPANCQAILTGQGITQGILNTANTVCNAGVTVTNFVGAAACVGIAATVVSCAVAPTGIGAVICAGGLEYSGLLSAACLAAISNVLANDLLKNPTDVAAVDVIGIQPGPPSLGGELGLICDAVAGSSIGNGTGPSGTTVTVSPTRPTVLLGNNLHFTVSVSGNSNTNVTWSVNGLTGGSGPFGTVDDTGLFKAPSILPPIPWITVRATSNADLKASAPAVVYVVISAVGTIVTVAGNSTAGYSGDGGPATSAELFVPSGIAFDGGGNMFIADSKNNVIRRVDAATGVISTIAGNGTAGFSGDGGSATSAELNGPTHVVFDQTVNLYITDANNNRIRKVNAATGIITTVAGNGIAGFSGDGGQATVAELNFPDGIALDGSGNVFIGDARNNRIRRLNTVTGVITTVAGNGIAGFSGDGGVATSAELNFPSRPAIDSTGDLYIADFQNNRVRRVASGTNIITTVAGTGTAGFSGDGGSATSAELNGPISVTVDGAGNLYIGETNNQRVRVVNTSLSVITLLGVTVQPGAIQTVAGDGLSGYFGDGGPAINAGVNFPTGLLIDAQGNLYFADANNNVARKIIGKIQ